MIRTAYLSSVGHDMAVAGCGRRKEPRWVASDELQACNSEGGRNGVLDTCGSTLNDTKCVALHRPRWWNQGEEEERLLETRGVSVEAGDVESRRNRAPFIHSRTSL